MLLCYGFPAVAEKMEIVVRSVEHFIILRLEIEVPLMQKIRDLVINSCVTIVKVAVQYYTRTRAYIYL